MELTDSTVITDRQNSCTDVFFLWLQCLLLALLTLLWSLKKGDTLIKINKELAEFNQKNDSCEEASADDLISHCNRITTVSDLRMGEIDSISIDLRCGFTSGSSSESSNSSNRSRHCRDLIFYRNDCKCACVLSNQIDNNTRI